MAEKKTKPENLPAADGQLQEKEITNTPAPGRSAAECETAPVEESQPVAEKKAKTARKTAKSKKTESEPENTEVVTLPDPEAYSEKEETVDARPDQSAEYPADEKETGREGKNIAADTFRPRTDFSGMDALKLTDALIALLKKEEENPLLFREAREIRAAFDALCKAEKTKKEEESAEHTEETPADFEPDPVKERFDQLWNTVRSRREKYQARQIVEQRANMEERLALIEELKSLIDKEENVSIKEFHNIQSRWRACGPVAREQSSAVWQTYHHHVERFFDYLNLNREFRDREFENNLKEKESLIAKAQELVGEPSVKKAFEQLQVLHRLWKEETGPVAEEFREDVWNRFSEATQKVHERRHEFLREQKELLKKNLEQKEALCEKVKAIAAEPAESHDAWQKKIAEVERIRDKFRSIPTPSSSRSNEAWEKFKEATREFNRCKNDFYKNIKKVQLENLAKKQELVDRAEALRDSTDWEKTADELKRMQVQWKTIGHVPRQKSDEVWNRFRGACNHFFEQLSNQRKGIDKDLEENLARKQSILAEMEALDVKAASEEAVGKIREYIGQWKQAGRVPRSAKGLDNKFYQTVDRLFDTLKMDRREVAMLHFREKVDAMIAEGDKQRLYGETDFTRRKIDEVQRELNQLQNNVSFFNTSADNPLLAEVNRKIEQQKTNLETWKEKLAYLRQQSI